jgi:erythromycin esterase
MRGDKQGLKELEWVIQNTRIVLEYAQLNASMRTRDESMADNIKWIADQNPGARIIVWAHNGHVAHGGMPSYTRWAAIFGRCFGPQYLNFGIAFNEASLQAVEMGKGLHDFTVGPAPDGSLDATLASAGFPTMALDVRTPPKPACGYRLAESTASDAEHRRRVLKCQAANYLLNSAAPEMFDVLVFVGKTTAARKITPAESK